MTRAASRLFRCESVVCFKVAAGWLGSSAHLPPAASVNSPLCFAAGSRKSAYDARISRPMTSSACRCCSDAGPCLPEVNHQGNRGRAEGFNLVFPCLLQRRKLCALLSSSFCLQGSDEGSDEVRMLGCLPNTGARRAGRRVRSVGPSGDGRGAGGGRRERAPGHRVAIG
jgi:hypothetical protein